MQKFLFLIVFGALLIAFSPYWAGSLQGGIPRLINYQGMLTDNEGIPLNEPRDLTFTIYDAPTDGTALWTETHTAVPIENGLFNVILGGATTPVPDSVFDQPERLLGIKVGTDPELTPRIQLTSVAYAYRAESADTADYALSSPSGPGDYTWTFRITDTADTTITTDGRWGIARWGNTLYGNADSTHVNLGVACITGTSGQNYKYCTVGGGYSNTASGGWATVGGGNVNTASGYWATVEGGVGNTASGGCATVGGGYINTADTSYSTVGGGWSNTASGYSASVGGGRGNTADTSYATVAGGYYNTANGDYATVAGGDSSTASGIGATVGGGAVNIASGWYATVGGGYHHTASVQYATVAGGSHNTASANYASVGGGSSNQAIHGYVTVGGGSNNTASGFYATVGGGYHHTASGKYSTVPGGNYNTASGDYSFATGRRAKANHLGTFVWADSSVDADFASTGNNQFLIRAAGGVGIGTNSPDAALVISGDGTSSSKGFLYIKNNNNDAGIRFYDKADSVKQHIFNDNDNGDNLRIAPAGSYGSGGITIEQSGDVGIGTTTPATKLAVFGLTGTSSYNYVRVNTSTGAFYYYSSSKRYKEDVRPLEDDFHKIFQAEPKNFIDKASGEREIGYIAEEFDGLGLNNLVIYDKEGRPDGLKYELVSLYLLEIVKDQAEMMKELEADNEKLRRRIETLEAR